MRGLNEWVYVYVALFAIFMLVVVIKLRINRRHVGDTVSSPRQTVHRSDDTTDRGGHVTNISRLPYDASREPGWPDTPAA